MTIQFISLGLANDHEFGDIVAFLTKIRHLVTPTAAVICGLIGILLGSMFRRVWEIRHAYEISEKDCHSPKTYDDAVAHYVMLTIKAVGYSCVAYAITIAAIDLRIWFTLCSGALIFILLKTPHVFKPKENYPPSTVPQLLFDRVSALHLEVLVFSIGFHICGYRDTPPISLLVVAIGLVFFDWIHITRREEEVCREKTKVTNSRKTVTSS